MSFENLYEKLVNKEEKLSLVGLGYVGMPIAVAFAKKINVVGFDLNEKKIELYKNGKDPTNEVGDEAIKNTTVEFTADETKLLASLIHCEAGGESYEGQVAVGAVVMNRVRSGAFPNTISEVIYASGQFTPALNGRLEEVYNSVNCDSCNRAAEEALSGTTNVGDSKYFRRVGKREGIEIGNHVFW